MSISTWSPLRDEIVRLHKAEQLLSSRDEIMDMLLNLRKSHKLAALTFEMIEKCRQTYELAVAATVGAMI